MKSASRRAPTWQGLVLPLLVTAVLFLAYLLLAFLIPESTLAKGFPVLLSGTVAVVIAVYSNTRFEVMRRQREEEDVRKVVYQEILFLTFRCAFDFKEPWVGFLTDRSGFNKPRAQKFRPDVPFAFRSLASYLALIPPRALARILRFDQALELWRRDLDYYLFEEENEVSANAMCDQLVKRLSDALQLGYSALEMLRPHVSNWKDIESEFRESLQPIGRPDVKDEEFIETTAKRAAANPGPPLF